MVDFGYDTSCTTSLNTGRFASGVRLVGEAIFRRLTTPHGTLQGGDGEQDYGLDLLNLIGSATTDAAAAALPGQIQAEVSKDERIDTVDVSVVASKSGPGVVFTIQIECTTAAGPFSLVMSVNDFSVALVGLTPGA